MTEANTDLQGPKKKKKTKTNKKTQNQLCEDKRFGN